MLPLHLVFNRGQPAGVNVPTPTLTRPTPDLLTKGHDPQRVKAKGVYLRSNNVNEKRKINNVVNIHSGYTSCHCRPAHGSSPSSSPFPWLAVVIVIIVIWLIIVCPLDRHCVVAVVVCPGACHHCVCTPVQWEEEEVMAAAVVIVHACCGGRRWWRGWGRCRAPHHACPPPHHCHCRPLVPSSSSRRRPPHPICRPCHRVNAEQGGGCVVVRAYMLR